MGSVALDTLGLRLLVGTQGSELFEVMDSGTTTKLVDGHCKGEVWGTSVCPTNADLIATSGDDQTVRVWSISEKRMIRSVSLDTPSRAIAWSPSGQNLAVGLGANGKNRKNGAFVVLDAETLEVIHEGRDPSEKISDVKFSPDGTTLVVASHDNSNYLYNASDFTLKTTARSHNS